MKIHSEDKDFLQTKRICAPLRAVADLELDFSKVRVFGSFRGKSAISTIGTSFAGATLSVLEALPLPESVEDVKTELRSL